MRIERRFAPLGGVEVREDDDGVFRFAGHASVFNSVTDLGPFREQVASGAFKKTLKEADVRFLYNHEPDSVMARTTNGSLKLSEDREGLATEAGLDPADWDVRRLVPKLRSGNVSQMSFAFRTVRDDWDEEPEDGGKPIRTLREVQLFDVSAVTFPAYEDTDAVLRSIGKTTLDVAEDNGIECPDGMCAVDVARIYRAALVDSTPDSPLTAEDVRRREGLPPLDPTPSVNDEDSPSDEEEEAEEPPTEEPSREDSHSLSETQALRNRRIEYLSTTIEGER